MREKLKNATEKLKKSATKSWLTTAVGVAGALGLILSGLYAQFDGNPETIVASWVMLLGEAATMVGFGVAARDHGVTSEEAGAK